MKYKKYLLFLIIILLFSVNKAYADVECYYVSEGFSAQFDPSKHKVIINKSGKKIIKNGNNEKIQNWNKSHKIHNYEIPAYTGNSCPQYIILHYDRRFIHQYYTYATDDEEIAKTALQDIGNMKKHLGYYARLNTGLTAEEYDNIYADSVFNNPEIGYGGRTEELTCDSIFGDKDDPDSIAYLINEILGYVRIIVPILIVILGTLDYTRAVMAGKEDEMRKAQRNFVRRVVIGVAVFFVPVLVNIIMWLADIVWEGLGYASCTNVI